jgi:hypothetical protein
VNQLVIPTTLVVAGLFIAGAAGHEGAPGDVLSILRDFGFPVYVSLWFMWRLEKRHDAYTARLEKLSEAIAVLVKAIDTLPAGSPGNHLSEARDQAHENKVVR